MLLRAAAAELAICECHCGLDQAVRRSEAPPSAGRDHFLNVVVIEIQV
jgi:hypothetical protein